MSLMTAGMRVAGSGADAPLALERDQVAPPRVGICAAGEIWGGVEQFVLTLAHGLRAGDVEAVVILFHDELLARKLRGSGIPVEVLDRFGKYDPRHFRQLAGVLRRHRINVLHVQGYKASVVGGLAARALGIKVVKTEHGRLEPLAGWRGVWNHCRLSANVAIERLASHAVVDGVAFVSNDIESHARLRRRAIPQRVIYNGIEMPPPRSSGIARRKRNAGTFNIGIVGRIAPVKGHRELLQALVRLRHLDAIRVHVFGTGPLEAQCRRWSEEWGVADRVRFHGFTPAVHERIAALDAVVIPSRHEGLPYVLLEAMALGVPVIASRVGGLREVLEESHCGLLVEPGDPSSLASAIERLLQDAALRAELVDRAATRVRQSFRASEMVREYADLYRRVLTH